MSDEEIYKKFIEEYCSHCTKQCTERSKGIMITYDYKNKIKSAKCDDYIKKEETECR